MRRHPTSKGQILILILLVLVGLVVIFALLSAVSVRVQEVPIVREVFWLIDDQRVASATRGEEVEAHVVVEATQEYVGSIVIKIRKDVAFWFDSDYHVLTTPVNLKGGEQKEIEITFTSDEASGGRLRGYFIEIEFRVTGTTWVMENSYPPRLKVTD